LSAAAHPVIGVFGGTFDPPHGAHLELARTVLKTGAADRVLFVPCYRHAFGKRPAAFEHRVRMCELLVEGEAGMEVSGVEATMANPGRTLDLIEALEAIRPHGRLRLIAGSDIFYEREKWYRFEDVERRAPPIYVERRGVPPIPVPALPAPPEVSSSSIRAQIAAGRSPRELVPPRVADFIEANGLYGCGG
jgi:nicotinate-nucleotide adenylyltransferase